MVIEIEKTLAAVLREAKASGDEVLAKCCVFSCQAGAWRIALCA